MNTLTRLVLVCVLIAAIAAPAFAHHSAAAYNTQQEVKVTGAVTVYNFKNPHVYLTLQVKKPDGSTGTMDVEAGAASVLNPLGFTKDSLKVGDMVTITGNPSRNSPDKNMLGKDLVKTDGTYYPLNIASRSVYVSKNETASSIAGTWFSPRTSFNAFLGGVRSWPVTDKGRAAMSVNDPKATTQKDCVPIGAPALMFYPVATTIKVEPNRVVLDVDWMDSVGRWEGKTLVVETTNFKEHPMGLSTSLPSSTQKKLTERFAVSADGKNLVYSGVIEDPVYLTKPVEWTGQWEYRPNMPHSNQKCDVDVARRFLTE